MWDRSERLLQLKWIMGGNFERMKEKDLCSEYDEVKEVSGEGGAQGSLGRQYFNHLAYFFREQMKHWLSPDRDASRYRSAYALAIATSIINTNLHPPPSGPFVADRIYTFL